jgi:hypothetical protein
MLPAVVLAFLFASAPRAAAVQTSSVLHIKVVLADAGRPVPVPHCALLVSDNPASAPPRRVVTAADGTADVRLPPGNYTVESDRPVAFHGKAYQWTKIVDIAAGREAVLELTAENADTETAAAGTNASSARLEADPSFLLTEWQDSVVGLWTATTHASGFVIAANGLVATTQRAIGGATSVEVQLTPELKVAGTVLVADAARDVALLWIDPGVSRSVKPVPLGCGESARAPVADGQAIFTISAPLRQEKGITPGSVTRVEAHAIMSDFILPTGSAGGPVFAAGGNMVGVTSVLEDKEERLHGDTRVVRIEGLCDVVASAEKKMKDAAPPAAAHLPVEPPGPFPIDALKEATKQRAGNLSPYQMSASDFDLAFITPVMTYSAQYQSDQARRRERTKGTPGAGADQAVVRPLLDFGNWSEYVGDFPPALLVRATPKMVEGFWTKVARGAAQTQGVSVPSIKHFKSGFSRMRAFCGDAEVTAIHPFKVEQRVSDTETIAEGLYVFDPGAFGPQCATVKIVLYSEKEPDKGDTRVVDPKVVEQIWQDFAPYRASR